MMPRGTFVTKRLVSAKAFGSDSGEETIKLDRADYLQGMTLRVINTNGTTSNTGEKIEDNITKIEIIGDGHTLYTATGLQCRNFEHFDLGHRASEFWSQGASAVQHSTFPIKFGRSKNDKDIILPAHMFKTLVMKISYSFTDSTTAGYTTSESNAKFDLHARYLVEPVLENRPFFKKNRIYNFTTTAIQDQPVDFPTGASEGAYRRIMVYSYEAAIEDGVDTTVVELLVNSSQQVHKTNWLASQDEDYERYGAKGDRALVAYVAAASATALSVEVGKIESVNVTGSVADLVIGVDALAGDQVSYDSEHSASMDVYTSIVARGVPFCTMIDLGTDDLEDSLDVTANSGVSSLKMNLTTGAAGALTEVMSEQLVMF